MIHPAPAAYVGMVIGLVPLLAMTAYPFGGRTLWLVAAAYGVSFLADLGGLFFNAPDLFGNLFPLGQAGLMALALWPARRAVHLIGVLTVASAVAVKLGAFEGKDAVFASVAALACLLVSLKAQGALRASLWATFGLGGLAWVWYATAPAWGNWSAYQSCRLAGSLLFCRAVSRA